MGKKLKIGWFSFSCCEDSTIVFTELLNDHYREWMKLLEFKSALVLKKKEDLTDIDVAFVEGAITAPDQEEKLKKIRSVSRKLVAIGACACVGMPSAQRNVFDEKTTAEIQAIMARFKYAKTVKKVSDIVTVDDQVPGCPMNETMFLSVVTKYLKEFHIIP
jgi:sulfhydrogenase subunit delta